LSYIAEHPTTLAAIAHPTTVVSATYFFFCANAVFFAKQACRKYDAELSWLGKKEEDRNYWSYL